MRLGLQFTSSGNRSPDLSRKNDRGGPKDHGSALLRTSRLPCDRSFQRQHCDGRWYCREYL